MRITLAGQFWNGFSLIVTDDNTGDLIPVYDLDKFDALSLWVRGSGPMRLTSVGFGEEDYDVSYTGEDGLGINVPGGDNWRQILIPVPVSLAGESIATALHFAIDQTGWEKDLYIDKIELIKCDVSLQSIQLSVLDDISLDVATPIEPLLRYKLRAVYKVDDRTVTLVHGLAKLTNWFDFDYDVTGDVDIDDGDITATGVGDYDLTVAFGGKTSNKVSCPVVGLMMVLQDFTHKYVWGAPNHQWWAPVTVNGITPKDAWYAEIGINIVGRPSMVFMGNDFNGPTVEELKTWDLTDYSTIRFGLCIPSGEKNATYPAGVSNSFGLLNGQNARSKSFPISTITANGLDTWYDVEIALSDFTSLNKANVTGWRVAIPGYPGNEARSAAISKISVYE
jgi:hypothetical protein